MPARTRDLSSSFLDKKLRRNRLDLTQSDFEYTIYPIVNISSIEKRPWQEQTGIKVVFNLNPGLLESRAKKAGNREGPFGFGNKYFEQLKNLETLQALQLGIEFLADHSKGYTADEVETTICSDSEWLAGKANAGFLTTAREIFICSHSIQRAKIAILGLPHGTPDSERADGLVKAIFKLPKRIALEIPDIRTIPQSERIESFPVHFYSLIG